jgi:uncharacterized repeat protein (TIGR01451 family)
LSKTVSNAAPKAGDTITYTLTLNVSGSVARAVTLTDNLPAGLNPSTVVFLTVPTGTVAGNTVTWLLGNLSPGTTTVSFSAQVYGTDQGGDVIHNTARATSPDAPTVEAAADSTVRGDVQVTIGIYNAAGELVKTVAVKYMSNPVNDVSLLADAILSSMGDSVTIVTGDDGRILGTWDGTNGLGALVANGTYYLKIDSVDGYGTTTSVTKVITVDRPLTTVTVNIYNAAGELVRTMYTETAATTDPLTGMTLSTSVIRPGGDGVDGIPPTVAIVLSSGNATTWDGRADNGTYVADGTYYVEVTVGNPGGGTTTITRTVSVLGSKTSTGKGLVRPNVLTPENPESVLHVDGLEDGQKITARLYTLAGDLVRTVNGSEGQNDLTWDSRGLESGMYFWVVETTAGGRLVDRTISKLLVRK